MSNKLCYYEGCSEVAVVKDLCLEHYNLWLGNVDGFRKYNRSLEFRFWSYVWRPIINDCWFWRGEVANTGYGLLRMKECHNFAHRVSWRLHYGDIPKSLLVLHKCDTPLCVNPKHLFLGTHADNMKDCVKKGRSLYGERNIKAKLTEDEVLKIRKLVRLPFLLQENIAKMFNVSLKLITLIKLYKIWNYPEILQREKEALVSCKTN